MKIKRSESEAILQSFRAGTTPQVGLQHVVVGRKREIDQILSELQSVKHGGGGIKILSGIFGSGKSFLCYFIQYLARQGGFVVAHVDFQPYRSLFGSGRGVATYREIVERFSTRTEPRGQALKGIIERWLNQVQHSVMDEMGIGEIDYTNKAFVNGVQQHIRSIFTEVEGLTGGYQFAEVLNAYWRGLVTDNEELQRAAIRWLRGEFGTKTEVRQALQSVRDLITDDNWYEYLRIWAKFVSLIGYAGLLVSFDECVNLYKITNPTIRSKNYEMILRIFNDATQGVMEHLYVIFSGTPEFVTDERRGLYSYAALKTRLVGNPYETDEFKDMAQPVIHLTPLTPEELVTLLIKLRDIHAYHYSATTYLNDADVARFVEDFLNRPGAREFSTTRECVRRFIGGLEIVRQNPGLDYRKVFAAQSQKQDEETGTKEDVFDDFELAR